MRRAGTCGSDCGPTQGSCGLVLRKWAEKPAFKIDFDKYVKERRFLGLERIILNNMVEDGSMLRENLGARVCCTDSACRRPARGSRS